MRVDERNAPRVARVAEPVATRRVPRSPVLLERVDNASDRDADPDAGEGGSNERYVEAGGVVPDDDLSVETTGDLASDVMPRGGDGCLDGGDAVDFRQGIAQQATVVDANRTDPARPLGHDDTALVDFHEGDVDDVVGVRVKPGRLDVEDDHSAAGL